MSQNLASMQITQEQEDQVMALFQQIEALLPGLVTLEPGDRATMSKLGPKSERFVRGVVDALKQNDGIVPRDVDLSGAVADLNARERMLRITSRARQFAGSCEDTTDALGSDLMVVSQIGYALLKVLGKSSGLDEVVKELGYRWARSKKKPKMTNEE